MGEEQSEEATPDPEKGKEGDMPEVKFKWAKKEKIPTRDGVVINVEPSHIDQNGVPHYNVSGPKQKYAGQKVGVRNMVLTESDIQYFIDWGRLPKK